MWYVDLTLVLGETKKLQIESNPRVAGARKMITRVNIENARNPAYALDMAENWRVGLTDSKRSSKTRHVSLLLTYKSPAPS